MDTKNADQPKRKWLGRGRGILRLAEQQNNQTEKRPGQHGQLTDAALVNQSERLSENSRNELRRPHQPAVAERRLPQHNVSNHGDRRPNTNSRLDKPQMENIMASGDATNTKTSPKMLMAKYSYKVNPTSPLGLPELGIKQGQMLALVEKHPTNEHWWKVQNESGGEGYVPASYMMIQEAKPSTLPWLESSQKQQEPEATEKPVYKPYVSAYNKPTEKNGSDSQDDTKKEYYCSVCDKQLNGPKPYGAHMTSKAHKEEVELAREMAE